MIVVYLSRAGENFAVGTVSEGNTAKLARVVYDESGATSLIEIVPDIAYPNGYDDAKAVIQRELDERKRPPITLRRVAGIGRSDRLVDDDSVIALGYPIWCGSVPAPVRTFLESADMAGVTILPFCTHGGSGLARTITELEEALPTAHIGAGLAILGADVQRDPSSAVGEVRRWLSLCHDVSRETSDD